VLEFVRNDPLATPISGAIDAAAKVIFE